MTLQKQDMSIEVDIHFIRTGLDTHRLIFLERWAEFLTKKSFYSGPIFTVYSTGNVGMHAPDCTRMRRIFREIRIRIQPTSL